MSPLVYPKQMCSKEQYMNTTAFSAAPVGMSDSHMMQSMLKVRKAAQKCCIIVCGAVVTKTPCFSHCALGLSTRYAAAHTEGIGTRQNIFWAAYCRTVPMHIKFGMHCLSAVSQAQADTAQGLMMQFYSSLLKFTSWKKAVTWTYDR